MKNVVIVHVKIFDSVGSRLGATSISVNNSGQIGTNHLSLEGKGAWVGFKTLCICLILLLLLTTCNLHLPKQDLHILIAPDFYPFAYTQADTLHGLEVELLDLLKTKLNANLTLTTTNPNVLLETLYEEDYHIAIGGITFTENRSEFFDFSPPYYNANQCILAVNNTNLDSLEAIANSKLGAINLSSSVTFIEETLITQQKLSANNLRKYPDYNAMLMALKNGEIAYAMLENTLATLIAKPYDVNIVYTSELSDYYCLVLKKHATINKSIIAAMSKVLNLPEWAEIQKKYLVAGHE